MLKMMFLARLKFVIATITLFLSLEFGRMFAANPVVVSNMSSVVVDFSCSADVLLILHHILMQ